MTESNISRTSAWRTIIACLIAPIIWAIAMFIVSFLFFYLNYFTTVLRPGIIGFFSSVIGAGAGVLACNLLFEKYLNPYSHKAVFFIFALIVFGGVIFEIFFVPLKWTQINSVASLIAIAIASYELFYKTGK